MMNQGVARAGGSAGFATLLLALRSLPTFRQLVEQTRAQALPGMCDDGADRISLPGRHLRMTLLFEYQFPSSVIHSRLLVPSPSQVWAMHPEILEVYEYDFLEQTVRSFTLVAPTRAPSAVRSALELEMLTLLQGQEPRRCIG